MLESYKPNLVYLQGEQLENNEIGSPVWEDVDLSTAEAISEIFSATLPTTVCIRFPELAKSFFVRCEESLHCMISCGLEICMQFIPRFWFM